MTSLFNPMTTIGKMVKPFKHPYKGTVVQVEQDPYYMGRIKVDIPELFGEYIETADGSTAGILPWIYPRFLGCFSGLVNFSVPEKGDVVEIIFPYENVYLGYYTNKPTSKDVWDLLSQADAQAENPEGAKIAQLFKDHYPNVYGQLDKNLTGWYVDKTTNEIFIVQGGNKCKIWFGPDGALNVSTPTNLIFNAGQSIMMNAGTSIEMTTQTIAQGCTDYSLQADSSVGIKGSNINTDGTVNHTGTVTSSGEGKFNGITVSQHKHQVPQSPSGTQESKPPTSGT